MTDISREAVERLAATIDRHQTRKLARHKANPRYSRPDERYATVTATLRALRDALDKAEAGRQFLWDLLDHIDTLDDACKENDRLFRKSTYAVQQRRHEISFSDGYTVDFNRCRPHPNKQASTCGFESCPDCGARLEDE